MSPRIDETLRSLGYKGIPLPDGKKSPPPFDWQRIAGTVEIFEGSNYGIPTEDFVVIDIDRPELVKRFLEKYPRQITMLVGTPRGGVHAYFAGRSCNQQNDGWDIRGSGGYVVGPGSIVGRPYTLLTEWVPKSQLSYVPEELLTKPAEGKIAITRREIRNVVRYVMTIESIQGKAGNKGLVRACSVLRDAGLSEAEAMVVMIDWNNSGKAVPPWSLNEIARALKNLYLAKGSK